MTLRENDTSERMSDLPDPPMKTGPAPSDILQGWLQS